VGSALASQMVNSSPGETVTAQSVPEPVTVLEPEVTATVPVRYAAIVNLLV
jgi:hypothetical protein